MTGSDEEAEEEEEEEEGKEVLKSREPATRTRKRSRKSYAEEPLSEDEDEQEDKDKDVGEDRHQAAELERPDAEEKEDGKADDEDEWRSPPPVTPHQRKRQKKRSPTSVGDKAPPKTPAPRKKPSYDDSDDSDGDTAASSSVLKTPNSQLLPKTPLKRIPGSKLQHKLHRPRVFADPIVGQIEMFSSLTSILPRHIQVTWTERGDVLYLHDVVRFEFRWEKGFMVGTAWSNVVSMEEYTPGVRKKADDGETPGKGQSWFLTSTDLRSLAGVGVEQFPVKVAGICAGKMQKNRS